MATSICGGSIVQSRFLKSGGCTPSPRFPVARLAIAFAALFGALGTACRDGTGPGAQPRVAVAAESLGSGTVVPAPSAEGRHRSIVIRGGPGLNCGVSRSTGSSSLRGNTLSVRLAFEPLGSCPFVGAESRWDAVVTGVPHGRYELIVTQTYFRDLGVREVLRTEVSVQY